MKLFTYGTLQKTIIQKYLYGRELQGEADVLEGYEKRLLSNGLYCAIPRDGYSIAGMVYELDDREMGITDKYEGGGYKRVYVGLASGTTAYVYVCKLDFYLKG